MTAKADRAKELLDNPVFREAIDNVRNGWLAKIEQLPLDKKTGMDALYDIRKMLHLLREVEDAIKQIINDGTLRDFRAQEQEGNGFLGEIKWLKKTQNKY